jgi:hypothetical protein
MMRPLSVIREPWGNNFLDIVGYLAILPSYELAEHFQKEEETQ